MSNRWCYKLPISSHNGDERKYELEYFYFTKDKLWLLVIILWPSWEVQKAFKFPILLPFYILYLKVLSLLLSGLLLWNLFSHNMFHNILRIDWWVHVSYVYELLFFLLFYFIYHFSLNSLSLRQTAPILLYSMVSHCEVTDSFAFSR